MPAEPTPPTPAPNRDLLWLIFGALMLIAAIQLLPLHRTGWGKAIGIGCLLTAGWVIGAGILRALGEWALREIPSPLTGPKERAGEADNSPQQP